MDSACLRIHISVWLLATLLAAPSLAQERPQALQKLETYRAALQTGQIEWSDVKYRENTGLLRGVPHYMTTRFANDDLVSIDRGDKDGVTVRDETGAPGRFAGTAPLCRFQAEDGVWQRADADLRPAYLFLGRTGVSDLRSLGAASYANTTDIHEVLWRDRHPNPAAWRYEESRDGDLYVVRVQKADSTTTYWLDPQRAWSPVRVRDEYHKHGSWAESRSSLKETDGLWFPEVVEFFSSKFKDGREPVQVVRVYGATFNRPEHPQRLSLADIGVDVGSYVIVHEYGEQPRTGRWDGQQVVNVNQLADQRIEEGPIFKRQAARYHARYAQGDGVQTTTDPALAGDPAALRRAVAEQPNQCESLWEAYTRNFIARYDLNEDQTQKALTILHDCQERGRAYLAKQETKITELDERSAKLREVTGPEAEAQRAALQSDREKLVKPLDDIFEKHLKPRLDRLPTRKQRAAGGAPEKPVNAP